MKTFTIEATFGDQVMAAVIDSGPVEATHQLHQVPKERWRTLMVARRCFMEVRLSFDCRCLIQFVDDAKIMFTELGYESAEQMVQEGYGLEPEEIRVAVEWLRLNPQDGAISLSHVEALSKHGGDRRSQAIRDQVSNAHLKGPGSIERTVARLKRDRPDLAERVVVGEMSANAAMVKAGFRKKTFTVPEDVDAAADVLIRRFGAAGIAALLVALARRLDRQAATGGGA